MPHLTDEQWMYQALLLAEQAQTLGEVPVGAILIKDNQCIAKGWNQPIQTHDPTAHAEIVAIRQAGIKLSNYRLNQTTLYVTLEPCIMCMGAITQARIQRLVFAADDPKRGAVCHALSLCETDFLNHRVDWQGGVLKQPCSELLTHFFRRKRIK